MSLSAKIPPPASSSTTLWATPSKEWVIPAKPKPGRKPKKDISPPVTAEPEADSKGRRIQNRAAQRAFRERKQSQLAELQAKVQQYEQGEIERNVALQTIAKRLKEENDRLRKENATLQGNLAAAEEERDALRELSRKRWRPATGARPSAHDLDMPARKRSRLFDDAAATFPDPTRVHSPYYSSPSTVASSPDSSGHTSFSPMPALPPSRDEPVLAHGNALTNIFDFISSGKTSMFEPGGALDTFNCGFCNDNTPCVCRELALQQVGERLHVIAPSAPFKIENGDAGNQSMNIDSHNSQMSSQRTSILDNLPAYQPPVPLRRRNAVSNKEPSVFPISRPSQPPSCTGDPSNCSACADDAFGKAFCAAISKTVSSNPTCGNCPCGSQGGCSHSSAQDTDDVVPRGGCCGNPMACTRDGGNSSSSSASVSSSLPFPMPMPSAPTPAPTQDTIPCDDAWRQLKSHPNVAFADLDLLAEVVARRSKCTGPRVEILPAPGSITPERGVSPPTLSTQLTQHHRHEQSFDVNMHAGTAGEIQQQIMLAPHTQYQMQMQRSRPALPSPPLQLVPQEVLVRCGRQRVREVQAEAVRDALRLLDAKFSLS